MCSVIPKLVIASQCLFLQVNMVNSQAVPAARMFLTTTLAVVMFTVFAQVLFLFVLFCCCCYFYFCCSLFLGFFTTGPDVIMFTMLLVISSIFLSYLVFASMTFSGWDNQVHCGLFAHRSE